MTTDDTMTGPPTRAATRRDALNVGGGAALVALALTGLGGRVVAAAQEARSAAGDGLEGRYVVIRLRKLNAARSADELTDLIREGFLPLVQAVPGFISYLGGVNEETGDQFSVTAYADEAGADESTRIAAKWGETSGANDYVEGDPVVVAGVIDLAAAR